MGTVRCPESTAHPRGAAQQDEHDGCDPFAKSAFEISPSRQSPNVPAIISIARGNEVNTTQTQLKSFNADVSVSFPEPANEYASAAAWFDDDALSA